MSLTAIIMTIIAAVSALLGALVMRPIARSGGVTEGKAQASQTQQVEQAQATVQAVKERAHVEVTVATDSDSELDARLSKHDRAD
jgi:Na+-translocating ferredoxin:NAD+ oxidoreductase RnfG subunit